MVILPAQTAARVRGNADRLRPSRKLLWHRYRAGKRGSSRIGSKSGSVRAYSRFFE
jgi:hypothetical protein